MVSLICGLQYNTQQKRTYRNRDQTDGCKKGVGLGIGGKGKGNIVINILISLHGDR